MSKFTSAFANYFEGFLQYKESHGHTRKSYLRLLEQFDQYCAAKYPNTAELTKDCVLGWIQKRPEESSDSFGRRTRLVRQLGEYMTLMSVPAYILPYKLGSGKSEFTPCLFTDHELKMFFHAADHIAPSPHNPFRAAVAKRDGIIFSDVSKTAWGEFAKLARYFPENYLSSGADIQPGYLIGAKSFGFLLNSRLNAFK